MSVLFSLFHNVDGNLSVTPYIDFMNLGFSTEYGWINLRQMVIVSDLCKAARVYLNREK